MSDLSDAILTQVVLELKEGLDGPAKERFTNCRLATSANGLIISVKPKKMRLSSVA